MDIHRFSVDDKILALDVPTSLCVELDELGDAALGRLALGDSAEQVQRLLCSSWPVPDVRATISEFAAARRQGLFQEEETRHEPIQLPAVTGLTLNVAHVCNLRCVYCFAAQGSYGGQEGIMDKATARRAIDLLMEASGQEQRCSVVFFGGEPLCNTPVIKDVVVYGRAESQRLGKTISFGMTTNGLLLSDSLIDFLTQNKVSILVSMDGPREVQDALRPAAGGKGSYDSLVPRVKALSRRRGGRISARATVSHQNVQVGRIVDHLASIGFGRVFCAPVSFACGNGALMLTEEDVDDITRDYEELALRLVDAVRERRPFPFGGFLRYIGRIHRAEKKLYGCGAGRNMIAVDPSGDVYPCHRFVGMEAFRMGSIFGQLDWDAVRRPFLEASVHALQRCSDCWARHLCGGYCLNEIARPDGSYDAPNPLNCRLVQREIELSLFVYAKIKELSPELLTRIGHRAPEAQGACNADPD